MSDKVIMVYTVNDVSAYVFDQTPDNMKVIGKWQDDPDQLFKLGNTVFNGTHVVAVKFSKRGPFGTVPE
ncbi:hypothetical protein LMG8526HA_02192 [Lactococcus lactis]|uniref:hypothetical protein n=1 Tax=Lactococcus lactis TaxID=1358 RepID=UPI00071E1C48|nr:hypothetical protein [Lactococcus lactis]MDU0401304.1 hypothetical protein [Lactococcus lactis]